MADQQRRTRIAHIVLGFGYGGLENGLVNLINCLDRDSYDHAVIALTEISEIAERIEVPGVQVFALGKRLGKDVRIYPRLASILRKIRPDILHTRNLGTLDCQLIGCVSGVRYRVHSEHGWDVHDPSGTTKKYLALRRILDPFVHRYVGLSKEIETWLTSTVGINEAKVRRICNGVDTDRFHPRADTVVAPLVIGTVTRFEEIKDPLATISAYARLRQHCGDRSASVKLLMVGEGTLFSAAQRMVRDHHLVDDVELVGGQLDTAQWFRKMDLFVLSSKREGISNTILEAMASGLPVVATNVGGNSDLVIDGETGRLVAPDDPEAIAEALAWYVDNREQRIAHGSAARARTERQFSIGSMVDQYAAVYGDGVPRR